MSNRWKRSPFLEPFRLIRRLVRGDRLLLMDYAPRPTPRWGYGAEPHPLLSEWLARGSDDYRSLLERFLIYGSALQRIPARGPRKGPEPSWINGFLPGLDAASIYALLALRSPRRYVEIGSGHSTRFANRAIRDPGLATEIVSIDPRPRASVAGLVHTRIELPLESIQPAEFERLLAPRDFLFFDGSHRCLTNSDVTVFFLEVLPRLAEEVVVQIHDVLLPLDYPPEWRDRHYSERYVLAAHLLGGAGGARVILPNAYVSADAEHRRVLDPLLDVPTLADIERHGSSFWFITGPAGAGLWSDPSPCSGS